MRPAGGRLRVGVLVSGRGSNLQALLDASARPDYPAEVVVVISDRERAAALDRARAAGIEALFVNPKDFADREAFDLALVRELTARRVGLVCNAGFMRILSPAYVRAFAGRAMNIHPSLLPAFTGLETHARALAAGVKLHGCTVHFVTAQLDSGPIVIQAAVRVRTRESADELAARVLKQEHVIYPRAARWFLDDKLVIQNGVVRVKGNDAQLIFAPD